MYYYFCRNNLLAESHFDFKKGLNSENVVLGLQDAAVNNFGEGNNIRGLFVYFSKAFNNLVRNILIDNLSKYGVNGEARLWFESNSTDVIQYVFAIRMESLKLTI